MVEETIRSIRETENRADGIVKEAEEKSLQILEEARIKAEEEKNNILDRAAAQAQALESKAQEEADRTRRDAGESIRKCAEELKASALSRKSEAVDLVISELI